MDLCKQDSFISGISIEKYLPLYEKTNLIKYKVAKPDIIFDIIQYFYEISTLHYELGIGKMKTR